MPPTTPPKPTAADKELAGTLNIQATEIAHLRLHELTETLHWVAVPKVIFTPQGVAKIRELLGLGLSPDAEIKQEGTEEREGETSEASETSEPPLSPLPPVPAEAVAVLLRVLVRHKNPTCVRVLLPDGRAGEIKVRNNRRLNPKTLLRCQQQPDQTWKCVHHGFAPRGN